VTCKPRFDYCRPTSLEEALRLKRLTTGSRFIAGGTDLMVQIKNRTAQPPALISLRSIRELAGIDVNGSARIGSMAPLTDLIEHPAIMTHASVPADKRAEIGITDSLVRLSVGVEDVEDLIAELDRVL